MEEVETVTVPRDLLIEVIRYAQGYANWIIMDVGPDPEVVASLSVADSLCDIVGIERRE